MSRTPTGFVDSLVSAVRENPLAAVLIGGGAFWLLVGDEKLKSAARSATAAASPLVDIGATNVRAAASGLQRTTAPPTAPEMDHEGSSHIRESLRGAGSAASDAMSEAADRIKEGFGEGVAYARENLGNPGKEALQTARSSLYEALERQPLILGIAGLVIGAAIAGGFRRSDLENEWVGEISDQVRADLETRAGAVSQSLREASGKLKAEIGDTTAETLDRVKQAGRDAADSAREKVRSPLS